MAAVPARSALAARLGDEVADALADWARLGGLSVDLPATPWSPPGRGYTGAVLAALEVAPPARVVVLKVLPAGVHRDEPHAHARALRESPPAFAAAHLVEQAYPPFPLPGGGALMFQCAAGDGLREAVPLRTLDGAEFTRACAEVVRGLLTGWNTGTGSPRRMRVSQFLRAQTGAAWSATGSLHRWRRRSGLVRPWFDSGGVRVPNPYLLVDGGHPELPDPEVSVLTGLAHRDLHLDNVLVPRRRGVVRAEAYRLIDLSGFRHDAALTCDAATLLLSALAPVVREPLPAAQQNALLNYVVNPRQSDLDAIAPEAAARVDCVRDTAAEIMSGWHDPWTDQFLLSILAGALMFTAFTDLGEPARDWYVRLAAHAGGQLLSTRGESVAAETTELPPPVVPATPAPPSAAAAPTVFRPNTGTTRRNGEVTGTERRKALVLALEGVPAMADPATREAVLRLLPGELTTSIPRSSISRVDLLGVVQTCLAFPGGLLDLWDAISVVDAGTGGRDALFGVLEGMPEFPRAAENDQG